MLCWHPPNTKSLGAHTHTTDFHEYIQDFTNVSSTFFVCYTLICACVYARWWLIFHVRLCLALFVQIPKQIRESWIIIVQQQSKEWNNQNMSSLYCWLSMSLKAVRRTGKRFVSTAIEFSTRQLTRVYTNQASIYYPSHGKKNKN